MILKNIKELTDYSPKNENHSNNLLVVDFTLIMMTQFILEWTQTYQNLLATNDKTQIIQQEIARMTEEALNRCFINPSQAEKIQVTFRI